jgi:hypothetical protein
LEFGLPAQAVEIAVHQVTLRILGRTMLHGLAGPFESLRMVLLQSIGNGHIEIGGGTCRIAVHDILKVFARFGEAAHPHERNAQIVSHRHLLRHQLEGRLQIVYRLIVAGPQDVKQAEVHVGGEAVGANLHGSQQQILGLVHLTFLQIGGGQVVQGLRAERIGLQGTLQDQDGLVVLTAINVDHAQQAIGCIHVRPDFQGQLDVVFRPVQIALHQVLVGDAQIAHGLRHLLGRDVGPPGWPDSRSNSAPNPARGGSRLVEAARATWPVERGPAQQFGQRIGIKPAFLGIKVEGGQGQQHHHDGNGIDAALAPMGARLLRSQIIGGQVFRFLRLVLRLGIDVPMFVHATSAPA